MKIKTFISGSQVLVTEDNCFYLKRKKNGVVFFKELTPCCQNEYMSCYKIPLIGRRDNMSRFFLVTKDGKLAADFVNYSFMIPYLLGMELLLIEHLSLGRFVVRLGNSYLWEWKQTKRCSVKVLSRLPDIEVSDDEIEVISVSPYKDILHYKYKGKDFYKYWSLDTNGDEDGAFAEVEPHILAEILDKASFGKTLKSLNISTEILAKAEKTAAVFERLMQIFDKFSAREDECAEVVLGSVSPEKLKRILQEEFGKCPAKLNLQQTIWKFAEKLA